MKRLSRARHAAMKCLFAHSLVGTEINDTLEFLKGEESLTRDVLDVARDLARSALERLGEIDDLIQRHLTRWDYSRVGNVEKAILRLAVCELLSSPRTPAKVVLNEALELANEFTTRQSVRFVNGVLDGIVRALGPKKPAQDAPSGPAS